MTLDCDVAVVGAGPAGSRTARNLARAGLRVRLLEEHRRVGVPSHCSGLISLRTLREAEIGDDAIIHRITGAFIHTENGGEAALGGGATRAVAIDRVRWDETLSEQAQAAGADLVRARLTSAEREDGHARLHTQTDGHDTSFTARVVVGADGAHSRVARSLGMAGPSERVYCLGIEGKLKTPRDDFVHVFVGSELAPGWFGWIIPTGDGGVRAGIGSQNGAKPIACYRRMTEMFPRLFAGIESCRLYGGTIPLNFAPKSYGDNVLLVGDAAGQVKPFSGGGIYTGLVAGRNASAAVLRAFERHDVSAAGLAPYERAWKREIGRELLRSLRIRRFGLALSDGEVERVVAALRSEGLKQLAARHGDIDYPSRVLLRLARSLPALGLLAWVTLRRPGAAWNLARAHLPFAL
jgi:digeranylgeranylglycerophospholipid reductase